MQILRLVTSKWFSLFILLIVFAFIVWKNFPFDGWLIGWDNVMPEFNFSLNLQRGIFSLWQENQGLGTISGHGFAATIPHTIVMFFLSLIFPIQHLRAVFTFLMLLVGSLGCFFLIEQLLKGNDPRVRNIASLLGGLFYMLNLSTVQNFYIQLEAFIIHFAALPWLFLVTLLLLEKPSKRRLLFFIIVNLLATAQGFIPPLFVTYMVYFLIFLGVYILKNKNREGIKRGLGVLLLTGIINAYWFLPVLYYTVSKSSIYLNSYNNLVTTEEFKLKNKKYGTLQDVAILRGFLFESIDTNESDNIFYIYEPWQTHWQKPQVQIIGYAIFSIILIGAFYFSRTYQKHYYVSFVTMLFLGFAILATDVPPFSYLTEFLQHIPVFNQAFRAGFTKFSISLSLFYSIFFAVGMYALLFQIVKHIYIKEHNNHFLRYFTYPFALFLSLTLIVYYSLPSFQGHFIYNRLRTKFPDSYFKLFDFFKTIDSHDRITDLPQGWNWGWSLYRWGYSGSGLLWYGINQAIMDRNFDVWGNYNENYYWEMERAIYADDREQFESLFDKYQINWVMFDENMIPYPNAKSYLYSSKMQELLDNSQKFQLVKTIASNDSKTREIKIYKVNIRSPNKYVLLANNLLPVGPLSKWNNYDKVYQEIGDYVTVNNVRAYYPFRSLFTGRLQSDLEFKVEDKSDYFSFTTRIPKDLTGGKLLIPPFTKDEITEIDVNDFSLMYQKQPQIFIDGELVQSQQSEELPMEVKLQYLNQGVLEIRVPKINGYYSYDTNLTGSLFDQSPKNCDKFSKGLFQHQKVEINSKNYLRMISVDSNNCLDFDLPNLSQKNSYLVSVESRNIEGRPLNLAIINKSTEKADLETILLQSKDPAGSYFIIPPMENYSIGYTIHIDNKSVGRERVVNDLGRITVNQIPYRFLTSLKVISNQAPEVIERKELMTADGLIVEHPNQTFYQITVDKNQLDKNITLVLSQSYDKSWRAYEITNDWLVDSWYMKLLIPLFAKKLDGHVLVNNWENGWVLPENVSKTVVLIYLPQYLEYLGFGLLGVSTLYLLLTRKTKSE